jgi:hypothetical protein
MFDCIWFCIVLCCQFVICYLSVVICHLDSCFVFAFIHLAQLFCIRFCSVQYPLIIQYSVIQCYFWPTTRNVFQVFWSTYTVQQTIINISGISGTNFSNWVRRVWNNDRSFNLPESKGRMHIKVHTYSDFSHFTVDNMTLSREYVLICKEYPRICRKSLFLFFESLFVQIS